MIPCLLSFGRFMGSLGIILWLIVHPFGGNYVKYVWLLTRFWGWAIYLLCSIRLLIRLFIALFNIDIAALFVLLIYTVCSLLFYRCKFYIIHNICNNIYMQNQDCCNFFVLSSELLFSLDFDLPKVLILTSIFLNFRCNLTKMSQNSRCFDHNFFKFRILPYLFNCFL